MADQTRSGKSYSKLWVHGSYFSCQVVVTQWQLPPSQKLHKLRAIYMRLYTCSTRSKHTVKTIILVAPAMPSNSFHSSSKFSCEMSTLLVFFIRYGTGNQQRKGVYQTLCRNCVTTKVHLRVVQSCFHTKFSINLQCIRNREGVPTWVICVRNWKCYQFIPNSQVIITQ